MKYIRQAWYYLLKEPFIWLFYWCFQPKRFRREMDLGNTLKRASSKCQLVLPIFLLVYPPVLILETILPKVFSLPVLSGVGLLLIPALGVLEGTALGFLIAMTLGAARNA